MKGLPQNPTDSVRKLNPHLYLPMTPSLVDVPIGTQARVRKRIRQSQKTMNKLEAEFYEKLKSIYSNVYYEPMRMRLCNGVVFIPDFMVVQKIADGCTAVKFFEVKGNQKIQDDASVKLKMAAQQYRLFWFWLVWKEKNGEWKEQAVLP